MKKLLLLLALIVAATFAFRGRGALFNHPIVVNEDFSVESVNRIWREVKDLDRILPIDEPIRFYLNSHGGRAQPTMVLFERMEILRKKGRKFVGTVYGVCYSMCGSLFAFMDKRYMTAGSVYLQHKLFAPGVKKPDAVQLKLISIMDNVRLKYDAKFLKIPVEVVIKQLEFITYIIEPDRLLKFGCIDAIVDQPDMEEI